MEKLIATIVFSMFAILISSGQSCLPEGITFTSQEAIDSFTADYPGCTEIEGEVGIAGPGITNLQGLNVLTSIGGALVLIANGSLTSLSGLDNLAQVGGNLEIEDNNALGEISGLENLASVGGDLVIRYNDVLASLSGLAGLTALEGNLSIWDNALTDLSGLGNLASVGGTLMIHQNDGLTSLTGLENVDPLTITGLYIYGNPDLSSCEAQSICNYLANPTGEIDIYDNAPGCSNPEEVINACESVGIDERGLLSFTIQPNPADNGIITIKIDNPRTLLLTFFNTFGQQIHQQEIQSEETTINVGTWTPGIYLAVVYEGAKPVGRAKFVVVNPS